MMQKITALNERNQEKMIQIEEKRRRCKHHSKSAVICRISKNSQNLLDLTTASFQPVGMVFFYA